MKSFFLAAVFLTSTITQSVVVNYFGDKYELTDRTKLEFDRLENNLSRAKTAKEKTDYSLKIREFFEGRDPIEQESSSESEEDDQDAFEDSTDQYFTGPILSAACADDSDITATASELQKERMELMEGLQGLQEMLAETRDREEKRQYEGMIVELEEQIKEINAKLERAMYQPTMQTDEELIAALIAADADDVRPADKPYMSTLVADDEGSELDQLRERLLNCDSEAPEYIGLKMLVTEMEIAASEALARELDRKL